MAPRYDEAPEVAPHALPEVHYPSTEPEVSPYGQQQHQQQNYAQQDYAPVKHEDPNYHPAGYAPPTASTTTYGYDQQNAYGGATQSEPGDRSKKGTICGCTLLVFILSIIVALLSAAVIGLAAGTGIEASRANDAESSLSAMKSATATSTSTASSPTSTADLLNSIDRNCTSNSKSVTGTTYTSFFFNTASYTIYCNQDTPYAPLQSLFVGNFDDCIDACSSYSYAMPSLFSNSSAANQTCFGVTFVPAWTNRTLAEAGTAPGNCYLKPGPQNETSLYTTNSGQEAHAAIVNDS